MSGEDAKEAAAAAPVSADPAHEPDPETRAQPPYAAPTEPRSPLAEPRSPLAEPRSPLAELRRAIPLRLGPPRAPSLPTLAALADAEGPRPKRPIGGAMALFALGGFAVVVGSYALGRWGRDAWWPADTKVSSVASCSASVLVEELPADSEVLLKIGTAPGDVEHLDAGSRAELVATSPGYLSKRIVVPPATPWEKGPNGRDRFELAVQLEPAVRGSGEDLWPLPNGTVPAARVRGDIHVVTMPPGAELWTPRGSGPAVAIDGLTCRAAVELLVVSWGGGATARQRLRVGANQLTPEKGQRAVVARVTGRL